ncbi:protein asteroid [Teleopsis dalmanni]|uniref:protein asteroid n=1 Tax=Teleopsis dalmanni TaxID=139649 RepID=UPI0018CF2DEE|nr:protein asteroid [Teleopsis dalmanni]
MGVRGLTSYIARRAELYLTPYELHDCSLVIDGDNLACNLYKDVTGTYSAFGGDYDDFYRGVVQFFHVLAECNVQAYVLMDGGYEHRKLRTVAKRLRGKISVIRRINPCGSIPVFPVMMKEVFVDAVRDCGIPVMRCTFEADDELAALGRRLHCPVLSYDSDFYIHNVQYIPLITLTMKAHTKLLKEKNGETDIADSQQPTRNLRKNEARHIEKLTTAHRVMSGICTNNVDKRAGKKNQSYKYLDCCIYRIENLITCRSLSEEKLPLFAALLGNDYISRSAFHNFFVGGLVKLGRSRKTNHQQRRIRVILEWLKHETVESALEKILTRLKKQQRASLLAQVQDAISGYSNEKCESYDFFLANYENVLKNSDTVSNKQKKTSKRKLCDEKELVEIETANVESIQKDLSAEEKCAINLTNPVLILGEENSPPFKPKPLSDTSLQNGNVNIIDDDSEKHLCNNISSQKSELVADDAEDNFKICDSAGTDEKEAQFVDDNNDDNVEDDFEKCDSVDTDEKEAQLVDDNNDNNGNDNANDEDDDDDDGDDDDENYDEDKECEEEEEENDGEDIDGVEECDGEESEHVEKVQFPVWFLKKLYPANLPRFAVDLVYLKKYINSPQIEHFPYNDCNEISIDILKYIYLLFNSALSDEPKLPLHKEPDESPLQFTYMGRAPRVSNIRYQHIEIEGSLTHAYEPDNPNPLLFQDFFETHLKKFDTNMLFEHVKLLPKDLQLYFIAIVFWLQRSQHCDLLHLHALIICVVILRTVDANIPAERDLKEFQKRFGKIIKRERQVREKEALAEIKRTIKDDIKLLPVPERMQFVPKSDCYLVQDALLKHFHMQEIFKKKYDLYSSIVLHAFAEFQSVVFQLNTLSALLDFPFASTRMGDLYSGVFLYNLYDLLRGRVDVFYYVQQNIFQDSVMMYDLYKFLIDWCVPFVPFWKEDKMTETTQQANKKLLKKQRQALRKKAAEGGEGSITSADPNIASLSNNDSTEDEFNDLNNKFCALLKVG